MTVVYGTPPPDFPPPVITPAAPARAEAAPTPSPSVSVPPPPPAAPRPAAPAPPAPPQPVRAPEWSEPAAAAEPRPPGRPRPDTFAGLEESSRPLRGPEPSLQRPRRRIPVVPIAGGVAVLAVAAVLTVVFTGKREGSARAAAAAADSARAKARADSIAKARADSIATYAPTPTVGWVRVSGDLPDDVILWLDSKQMSDTIFQASPGTHNLEVETGEFQPWETRIRVRAGDTLRVNVELVLKPPPDSQP